MARALPWAFVSRAGGFPCGKPPLGRLQSPLDIHRHRDDSRICPFPADPVRDARKLLFFTAVSLTRLKRVRHSSRWRRPLPCAAEIVAFTTLIHSQLNFIHPSRARHPCATPASAFSDKLNGELLLLDTVIR